MISPPHGPEAFLPALPQLAKWRRLRATEVIFKVDGIAVTICKPARAWIYAQFLGANHYTASHAGYLF